MTAADAHPRRSVSFDRVAAIYDETRGLPPEVTARIAADIAAAGGLGPSSRVLEVGVGTGRIALPLCAHVRAVYGVDVSPRMLRRLEAKRAARPLHATRADAVRLPFPDHSFDAALAVHVFHLIPGWREALAEVVRVLRPGGGLVHAANGVPLHQLFDAVLRRSPTARAMREAGVQPDDWERFLEDAGWRLDGEPRRFRFPYAFEPHRMLGLLRDRAFAYTFPLSEEQLGELLEAARAAMLEHFGDLERCVAIEAESTVGRYLPPARAATG